MGGACDPVSCGIFVGFGASTEISGSPPDTFFCDSIGANCNVEVTAVCSD